MMQQLFLNKKLSLLAKQKGFAEKCLAIVSGKDEHYYVSPIDCNDSIFTKGTFKGDVPAPLYQQIIDWFREKHIRIIENPMLDEKRYLIVLDTKASKKLLNNYESIGFLVLQTAIEEAFKLI